MTKASEFPEPKLPSHDSINEICVENNFDCHKQKRLKAFLKELVGEISDAMKKRASLASPRDQAENLRGLKQKNAALLKHLKTINKATKSKINESIANAISDLISADSLADISSEFCLPAPPREINSTNKISGPRCVPRSSDNYERENVHSFMRHAGTNVLAVILQKLNSAIDTKLKSYKHSADSHGGAKKNWHRRNIILNTLSVYEELGGKVTKSCKNAKVILFCESVFEAMGLPTDGIAADLPRAYEELQNRRK